MSMKLDIEGANQEVILEGITQPGPGAVGPDNPRF